LPDVVKRALESEKTFTSSADVPRVEAIYRSFFFATVQGSVSYGQ